eukprot:CAMPEP_0203980036 /NCGR_PEP_ID=MMETSP0360-20130528/1150_1 /ASSEMBLY_ACC=CAM_ASM_000342 /TAXON_ID=268821 /ORGANISM="Scrippsiella Hangoei, Strain SHTV-5" /LENGTH=82 /DNA_ID=CAMNT_0050918393 /DNA_START=62 /DNA_END=307 /DNA_ORIENTATION=+
MSMTRASILVLLLLAVHSSVASNTTEAIDADSQAAPIASLLHKGASGQPTVTAAATVPSLGQSVSEVSSLEASVQVSTFFWN